MAKKSNKLPLASILVTIFAILAIVAFFIPSMQFTADDKALSGLDMTMELFSQTDAIDALKDTKLAPRFAWSTIVNAGDNAAATTAMEVFAFASIICAGIMLILGLLGIISKKKNKTLRTVTTIFSVLTLITGISGLICGIVLQSAFTAEIFGKVTSLIAISASTIIVAIAGLLGTLSNLIFKK